LRRGSCVDRGICEGWQDLDNDGGLRGDGTQKGLIFDLEFGACILRTEGLTLSRPMGSV
jgi:hypothetical protein